MEEALRLKNSPEDVLLFKECTLGHESRAISEEPSPFWNPSSLSR